MYKRQIVFIKNQDIYLLKSYITVSSKPSKAQPYISKVTVEHDKLTPF